MKIYYNPILKQLARNLRNKSTLSEVILWNHLKGRQMWGYQFMRQKPIGDYIVDFFCSKLRMVIEIDGGSHHNKEIVDKIRQRKLESWNLTVLRFDDLDVKKNLEGVLTAIENWILENEKG
ncbi:MAG: endonuclease domain-containing protein [Candidatus Marinimicrobia bacterium]|nr:endonuclease domain-containing protein [Candidatus Neomarinimicrobiota bacterium]